jgi:hypothetical protein
MRYQGIKTNYGCTNESIYKVSLTVWAIFFLRLPINTHFGILTSHSMGEQKQMWTANTVKDRLKRSNAPKSMHFSVSSCLSFLCIVFILYS